jgi:2-furoyl-CoA dehydrogenase large subunit
MGDGSSMLTPAAIANAVADALGRDDITLPLTMHRVWGLANGVDPDAAPRTGHSPEPGSSARGALIGEGEVVLSAPVAEVWRRLVDANELAAIVPGCRRLTQDGPDRYSAEVVIGIAGIRGTYDAHIEMRDKREPHSVRLIGKATGALGFGSGSGFVTLTPEGEGRTRLKYRYEADVGGKVASVGQRMLGSVTRLLVGQFFRALQKRIDPDRSGWRDWLSWWRSPRQNGGAP